jgi:AbrB family looped-hinge helix DNA binding protein
MNVKKKSSSPECCAVTRTAGCCSVHSIISVDERGQMVLPKEIREKAGIHAGDKLAVVSWNREGRSCCISLIKVDEMAAMVKGMLGPVLKDIIGQGD